MNSSDNKDSKVFTGRIRRSRRDRIISGVCGGLAEYLGIDSTVLRVIWVAAVFIGGSGLIAYIAGMIIIPREKKGEDDAEPTPAGMKAIIGVLLLCAGLMLMFHKWLPLTWTLWPPSGIIMPLALILAGGAIIFVGMKRRSRGEVTNIDSDSSGEPQNTEPFPKLRRRREERVFLGICAGIGYKFSIDPVLIRLIWIVAAVFTKGAVIVLYLLLYFLLPVSNRSLESR